ncbi:MAG: hypothetical protein KatS3mg111_3053 [Pirellulaceae bacterium]|nr:MAG: hypothetical protein KatS3mg111_3053 [Pirellulaceae bacterium]
MQTPPATLRGGASIAERSQAEPGNEKYWKAEPGNEKYWKAEPGNESISPWQELPSPMYRGHSAVREGTAKGDFRLSVSNVSPAQPRRAACAAAKRAIGTRNGEQLT